MRLFRLATSSPQTAYVSAADSAGITLVEHVGLLASDPPHVRIFGVDGDPLHAFGELGDGPGELRGPTWAAAVGYSIVVRHRPGLTMFGPDGAMLRTQAAPSESYEALGRTGASWLFAGRVPKVDDHSQPNTPDPPTAPGFVVALGVVS